MVANEQDRAKPPAKVLIPTSGKRAAVSFEFFPPRSEKARVALDHAVGQLAPLGPKFMTVTYGAGGTTTDPTLQAVLKIQRETGIQTASHLTFVSTPIWDVATYAARLKEEGVGHVVALRGDPPAGKPADKYGGPGFFRSSPAFIASLKTAWGFDISISAYPEKHPDAPSSEGDIDMLARKADAGASRAITQFFFDNDTYFRFLDEADDAGVRIPIVPGVLPVLDFAKMTNFAARCGANVPSWMAERFAGVTDPVESRKIGLDIFIKQIDGLLAEGVDQIHIFTLNEADYVVAACAALPLGVPS